ncbi:MAG: cupredoxin domain-containing protein [Dehalococcoidales bacterium]|nr:cupredoxin domain-containing protein [Dehalococcoidales bacterium]
MRITWAVTALLTGVSFVIGACTSPVAPTTLAPAIIAPVTLTPVATATPAPLTPSPAAPIAALPVPALVPVPWPGPNEVWLWGGEYRPSKITVRVGTTVTWKGKDADPHDVEGDTGLFFCSLPLGISFNYTFDERGTFPYHCECNPGMVGVVIVE